MKGIFKVLSMVILVAALIGAGVLVKNNQETRRGATAAETSTSILPDTVSTNIGQNFTVDVWLNTGKSTDKLAGAEFNVAFDNSKVAYVSSVAQNGYTILDEGSEGGADRWFKVVAMKDEKAGAVDVVKMTFRSLANGSGSIIVGKGTKVMISGQTSTWDVTKNAGSVVNVGPVTQVRCGWCGTSCTVTKPGMMCTKIAPPKDQSCVVNKTGTGCQIVPIQDKPCSSDASCSTNEYCYQPPMPTCAPGMGCIEMMPMRVCRACTPRPACIDATPACALDMLPGAPPLCPKRACTPRLACMDANPPCMPDLAPGSPGFCPKPTCTPRPACLDATPPCMIKQDPNSPPFCPKPTTPCGFCGTTCGRLNPLADCPAIAPANGTKCVEVAGKCVIQKATAKEGEMCGGIRGIMCETGLRCEMLKLLQQGGTNSSVQSMYADQSGICVRDTTYCDATGKCPSGYQCVRPPTVCPLDMTTGRPTTCAFRPYCKKVVVTVTPPAVCGQRCTSDTQCKTGLTCAPIWWPCGPMPVDILGKVQTNQPLDTTTVNEMVRICPMVASVLPSGTPDQSTGVRMPSFYGVCRNPKCVSDTDCNCTPVPQCTPVMCRPGEGLYCPTGPGTCVGGCGFKCGTPTPTPTVISGNQVDISGAFFNPNVSVGSEVFANISVNSHGLRVSAVNTQVTYDTAYFDFVESLPSEGATVLKNTVDKVTGKVTVYISWNLAADKLPTNPVVTRLRLKTKKVGIGTFKFDKSYLTEVSGLDSNGRSSGFVVGINNSQYQNLTITEVMKCAVCMSGKARNTGNANCDEQVNSVDFEIWRNEMFDQGGLLGIIKSTWSADFNCDQKVSGIDFEIWRKTVFQ